MTALETATPPPSPATGALLDVHGLSAGYGQGTVLREVDVRVPGGQIVAVLGANGAGKTTLLRAVSGLVTPTAGSMHLDGVEIAGLAVEDRVRRGLAHVPEGHGVIADLTVVENLRLGGLWRHRGDALEARLEEVCDLFPPLRRRLRSLGHELSGGERQMLAIGRALVADPRVLLLDEPSLGLAPRVVADTMTTLRHLCDTTGLAVLLVEQNVRSALSVADHGVVLHLGRVVVSRPAAGLLSDESVRHAYLGF